MHPKSGNMLGTMDGFKTIQTWIVMKGGSFDC